jgi:hypothetical protein
MITLNDCVNEYQLQLKKGYLQIAYQGIMGFMTNLIRNLKNKHHDYHLSSLYFGYMDMTYFAFVTDDLKSKGLKIAIVYLHSQNKFAAWLCANNKSIQKKIANLMSNKHIEKYRISQLLPGVDSIIEKTLIDKPNFNNQSELLEQINDKSTEFLSDIRVILKQ